MFAKTWATRRSSNAWRGLEQNLVASFAKNSTLKTSPGGEKSKILKFYFFRHTHNQYLWFKPFNVVPRLFFKKSYFRHWFDSNFIPRNSKKFEYRNFDKAIRIYIENESETRKNEFPWLSKILIFFQFKILKLWRAFAEIQFDVSEIWLAHLKEGLEICEVVYYEGILIWL